MASENRLPVKSDLDQLQLSFKIHFIQCRHSIYEIKYYKNYL